MEEKILQDLQQWVDEHCKRREKMSEDLELMSKAIESIARMQGYESGEV